MPLSVFLFILIHLLGNLLNGKIMLPAQRIVAISGTKSGLRKDVLCQVFSFRLRKMLSRDISMSSVV